jgi:hypothetical protein
MKIKDGTGTGREVQVDKDNRLKVQAVNETVAQNATHEGLSYNVNSGLVTLTDATEQGILYLKNNEDLALHISTIILIMGPSTGGATTDTSRIRFYKNPSTGTLISSASNADTSSNRNFSSSRLLVADAYKGDGSATVTDGSVHIESLVSPGNRAVFAIDELLSKGDTIAITIEPNDSNTSMKTMAAIVCFLEAE